MLNLLSLALGLLAWGLGVVAIVRKGNVWCLFSSFTACGLSLAAQFFEISRRVYGEDWSALLDICDTLDDAALILLAVTAALNAAALLRERKGRR